MTPPSGPAARPIRLVVNADDFGICARVNAGIVRAHRAGILTAASLMAAGGAFDDAVRRARDLPELDLGVHLTLVAARPLSPGGSTLGGPDGRFPAGAGAFLRAYLAGRIRLTDVRAELCAQIERVLDHGLRISHLDSHQHVHALPGIGRVVRELASRYAIAFVRRPVEDFRRYARPAGRHDLIRLGGAAALRACWTLSRLAGGGAAVSPAPRFLGFREGGRLDRDRLEGLLGWLRPGAAYELMCHPGFEPDDPQVRSWGYRHTTELAALTHPEIRAAIDRSRIRLCGFRDLAAA